MQTACETSTRSRRIRRQTIAILSLLVAVAAVLPAADPVAAFASVFTDGAMLQRGMAVPVWGTGAVGAKVTVSFAGHSVETTSDAKGAWMLRLPSLAPSADGGELVAQIGSARIALRDVVVGDVWFCSGQSNMAKVMADSPLTAQDIAQTELPAIRYLRPGAPGKAEEGDGTDGPAQVVTGRWLRCTPKESGAFTAAGFYFARRVHRDTGVPIGLICNAVSSSRIERWIPPEAFPEVPGLVQVDGKLNQKPFQKYGLFHGQFTARIIPYGIKGMLWYQGEQNTWNVDRADLYAAQMRALAGGLRQVWGQGEFPFYFVQLPQFAKEEADPAGGGAWAAVRLGQLKALSLIPASGMAITIDNSEQSIHPDNKPEVGDRLARLALVRTYGIKDLVDSGPLFRSAQVEGAAVRIAFDHVGAGLMVGERTGPGQVREVKDGKLAQFAIADAGPDGKMRWQWAQAVIDRDAVVVSAAGVAKPLAVQYANSNRPTGANLFNRDGLPASPFRHVLAAAP